MAKAPVKKNLSAIKRARQAEKRQERNKSGITRIKTAAKKVLAAVEVNDKAGAKVNLRAAAKVISAAASKGVIHKNTASRKISRLAKRANKIS